MCRNTEKNRADHHSDAQQRHEADYNDGALILKLIRQIEHGREEQREEKRGNDATRETSRQLSQSGPLPFQICDHVSFAGGTEHGRRLVSQNQFDILECVCPRLRRRGERSSVAFKRGKDIRWRGEGG